MTTLHDELSAKFYERTIRDEQTKRYDLTREQTEIDEQIATIDEFIAIKEKKLLNAGAFAILKKRDLKKSIKSLTIKRTNLERKADAIREMIHDSHKRSADAAERKYVCIRGWA